jgi:hypothetical protein
MTAGLSRKEFLAAAGGVALAGLLRPSGASAAVTPQLAPTDLTFTTRAQYRPFEIVAAGFEAVDDAFAGTGPRYSTFAPAPEDDPGTVATSGGALTVSGRSYFALLAARANPVAPYAAVQVDVAAFSDKAKTQNAVYAGLVADAANYVAAVYDPRRRP